MSMYLTDDHELLRTHLRRYLAANAPRESVEEWDRTETFPEDLYRGLASLGILGLTFSEEYGGNLGDELAICVVAEEIARVAAFLLYAYFPTVTFCARAVFDFGTEEQRRRILPAVAQGTLRMAIGLTEPDAGSDLRSLRTRAEPGASGFTLRGQKVFTTGADSSRYILTLARVPDAEGAFTTFLVPTDAEGVSIRPLRKLAGQATHTCEVFFDDVELEDDAVLGGREGVGNGMAVMLRMLDGERVYVAAQGVGMAEQALEWSLVHARRRVQFGKPIIEHQAVGHMLADMRIDVEAARHMTYHAASLLQTGQSARLEAAMAKVFATEAASRCVNRGMQTLGGYSYLVESGMERLYRECKLNEIAGGTSQILRNVVAQSLRREGSEQ
jgi:alkylation response protein AidB-like acyl-CoA dehydrogenase